jgi:hypothetical protein
MEAALEARQGFGGSVGLDVHAGATVLHEAGHPALLRESVDPRSKANTLDDPGDFEAHAAGPFPRLANVPMVHLLAHGPSTLTDTT